MTRDSIVNQFLQALAADRSRGLDPPLEEYLDRYPGHEAVIRDEWAQLHDAAAAHPTDAETPLEDVPSLDSRIGTYRLVRELGRGGQGVVFLAEDTRLSRRVALKLLTRLGRLSPQAAERFRREARVAARLDHPGICTIHEAGDEDGILFIAMRYVEGASLARLLEDARRRSRGEALDDAPLTAPPIGLDADGLPRTLELVEKAARAVHMAHEAQIIHRDIKPGNVMVTVDGDPVLLDFGLARDLELSGVTLTRTEGLLGTPAYAAPEQLRDQGSTDDRRIDVHALGALLYECVTLRRPFEGTNREALFRAILHDEPTDPRRLNPALDRDTKTVLDRALAKEPGERYATAQDLADDLGRLRRGEPVRARPISALRRAGRWARRRPGAASALALAVVAAALLGFLVAILPDLLEAREIKQERAVQQVLETAWLRLGEERHEEAAQLFSQALDQEGDAEAALAGLLLSLHTREGAEKALEVVAEHPGLVKRSPPLQMLERELRRIRGATFDVQVPDPESSLGWYIKGWIRILHARTGRLGLWMKAAEDISRAILDPDDDRSCYYFTLAAALEHLDQPRRANWLADLMLDRWPGSASARYWAARALVRSAPERSMELLLALCREEPDHVPARLAACRGLRLSNGDAALSERLLSEAEALAPDSLVVRRARIYDLSWQKHYEAAAEKARELSADEPTNGKVHLLLGRLLLRLTRHREAAEALRAATQADPLHWLAHDELGRALAFLGEVGPALEAFDTAASLEPLAFSPHCNRGLSLLVARRDREAVEAFRRAHALEPKSAHAAQGLAKALWLTGDPASALAVVTTAGIKATDPWRQRFQSAVAFRETHEDPATLDLGKATPEQKLLAAVALEAQGNYDRAAAAWARSPWASGPSPADAPRFRAAVCLLRSRAAASEGPEGRARRRRALAWLERERERAARSRMKPPGAPLRVFAGALLTEALPKSLEAGQTPKWLDPIEEDDWLVFLDDLQEALEAQKPDETSPQSNQD